MKKKKLGLGLPDSLLPVLIGSIAFKIYENLKPDIYPVMLNKKLKLKSVSDDSGIKMRDRTAEGFNEWQAYINREVRKQYEKVG